MTGAESRTFSRAAAVLLVAGVARWAYEARRGEPLFPPDSAGVLPALLEESRAAREADRRRRTPLEAGETIDPNRAPPEELDRLPGVGPSVAGAIVAEREAGRFFGTAEDLTRVRGIGPATLERIRPHLDLSRVPPGLVVERLARGREPAVADRARTVGPLGTSEPAATRGPASTTEPAATRGPASTTGPASAREPASTRDPDPSPVDVNRATAAELEVLPGIGPALAGRIVASREAEGPFGSVEDLARVRGIGPATVDRLRPLVRTGRR